MDNCRRFMKWSLFITNIVIFCNAIFVTMIAGWGLTGKPLWTGEDTLGSTGYAKLNNAFIVLLIVGFIIMSTAVFGIIAALWEGKCALLIYFIITFMVFVIEIIGGVQQNTSQKELLKIFEEEMENSFNSSYDEYTSINFWDTAQSTYQCCGINSWKDWEINNLEVPYSCCVTSEKLLNSYGPRCENISEVYTEGCMNKMRNRMQHLTNITNGTTISVACLMFFGMIFSGAFYKKIK